MAFTEVSLAGRYDLVKHRVISSTQIASRATEVVASLTAQVKDGGKPAVVCLTAQAKVASKLVSIVEIAKRDMASHGVKCFQYNALSSQIVNIPRTPKKGTNGTDVEVDPDDDFETMPDPNGTTKKRNVPVMNIYLSAVAVRELRSEYGEQR